MTDLKPLLLGFDIGSSFIKVSLVDAETGELVATASAPDTELPILSPNYGWAEQDPESWWKNAVAATHRAMQQSHASPEAILAIGIAYQMHGLVVLGKDHKVLRPAIIWCDSRSVATGDAAFRQLGESYCMEHLLNSPGNFTASKLKWVKDNEPGIYRSIYKALLPGDYLAMRMTDEICTTVTGLSEAILWDYKEGKIASGLLDFFGISADLIPSAVPVFSEQGKLSVSAAETLGLKAGTPIAYRAGDQPNNAFALQTLHPGETAATAGTSGVIYSVTDQPLRDHQSRVNTFVHVNHSQKQPHFGVLMCINGTGIMNSWLKRHLAVNGKPFSYHEMNDLADKVPVGCEKLFVLPFGNGAERILNNENPGASIRGLDLIRHNFAHLCRAVQEGIAFSFGYGFDILETLGIQSKSIRAGNANLFLSKVFCEAFVQVTGNELRLFNTDGSQGAARGAGIGIKYYTSFSDAFRNLTCIHMYEPKQEWAQAYADAFGAWKLLLKQQM